MSRSLRLGLLLFSVLFATGCEQLVQQVERFSTFLTGSAEVPPVATAATGTMTLTLQGQSGSWVLNGQNFSSNVTAAHIHGPAGVGVNAGIIVTLSGAQPSNSISSTGTFGPANVTGMTWDTFVTHVRNGMTYVNVHTTTNPGGEVRGQL